MTQLDDFKYVKNKMDQEGFHYCFKHYSYFPEIEDTEFHKLRVEYLEAFEKLEKYVNDRANDYFYDIDDN